jgi:hypothetical protein
VVSAIANQTGILRGCIDHVQSGALSGGSNLTCSYALKWVAHFLGDIHQPLHANGRAVGGNTFKVVFGGAHTQLHAVRTRATSRALKLIITGLGRLYSVLRRKREPPLL